VSGADRQTAAARSEIWTWLNKRGPLVGHSAHQLVLKARDFVFNHQFATLQLNDLEVVDRRMSTGFSYFGFQGAVPPFQFC
jgi:hypothetical protein